MFCYCSVCDDPYVPHFAALLASVADHGPAAPYFLIGDSIAPGNREKLAGFAKELGVDLTVIDGTASERTGLKTDRFFSPAVWLKVFAPMLLPSEYDRALILDCDMIVIGDLGELVQMDLAGAIIATGPDAQETESRSRERLGLPDAAPYGNTGALLCDLDAWRNGNCSEAVRQYALANPEKLDLVDQCAINAVLWQRNVQYDRKWNFLVHCHETMPADPRILHFAGPEKPWRLRRVPGSEFYRHYRDRTPWPDPSLGGFEPGRLDSMKLAFKQARRSLLAGLGIKKYAAKLENTRFREKRGRELLALFDARGFSG